MVKTDKQEMIIYEDGELHLNVAVSLEQNTVWLTLDEMAILFEKDRSVISRHVLNIFREGELDETTSVQILHESKKASRPPKHYNLDVIISVGYRVKSRRGITFRRWATSILKDFMIKGYALNEKRLQVLNRVVEIQSNIIADVMGIEAGELMKVINEYSLALELLDDYDHQSIEKPEGTECIYQLTYEECVMIIKAMDFNKNSSIFGIEKDAGKLEGIVAAVYQSAFGEDVYPMMEEKAANLLYFIIKDHPFIDGCKRIAASLFLYFLDKNGALFRNGKKIMSDSTLVAITLLLAESKPEEKDVMVKVIMNFMTW